MPFDYYYQLAERERRTYRESDAYDGVELTQHVWLQGFVPDIEHALAVGDLSGTEAASQQLLLALCDELNVEWVTVSVEAERPADDDGELHGLYQPNDEATYAHITVWMRTAKRHQVVAFRTFLRTLLHEFCHHLDYELLALEDSFHTQGFFSRESDLFNQLVPEPARA